MLGVMTIDLKIEAYYTYKSIRQTIQRFVKRGFPFNVWHGSLVSARLGRYLTPYRYLSFVFANKPTTPIRIEAILGYI